MSLGHNRSCGKQRPESSYCPQGRPNRENWQVRPVPVWRFGDVPLETELTMHDQWRTPPGDPLQGKCIPGDFADQCARSGRPRRSPAPATGQGVPCPNGRPEAGGSAVSRRSGIPNSWRPLAATGSAACRIRDWLLLLLVSLGGNRYSAGVRHRACSVRNP